MDIKEGNKLIAEFMGHSLSRGIWYMPDYSHYVYKGNHSFKMDCFRTERLSYNSSWDWLMPVVEKILSSDMYHKIGETETSIVGISHMSHVKTSLMSTHILTVYEAVVEFIKWYNKNKTL